MSWWKRGEATRQSAEQPYNNNYCLVFRLSGNQLKEVTEYFDTELVTAALGHADHRKRCPTNMAFPIKMSERFEQETKLACIVAS